MTLTTAMRIALDNLSWHWGEAYDIAVTRAGWVAKRLDNGDALVAPGPDELRAAMTADYAACPVPHDALAGPAGPPS